MSIISIIIPAFMEEKRISECLDSLLAQTFTDFEVLCIDDNSTDSTYAIMQAYSEKDSRISAYKNPSKGVASARNLGLKNVKSDYIFFADSDDALHPQALEYLYKAVKDSSCKIAVCNFERQPSFTPSFFDYRCEVCSANEIVDRSEFLIACTWGKLYAAELLADQQFSDYKIGEDTVFSASVWKSNGIQNAALVDLPLYHYARNSESTLATLNSRKRTDMVRSRIAAYDILNGFNDKLASFYLEQGLLYITAYKSKKIRFEPEYKKQLNTIYRKYVRKYLTKSTVSLPNKVYIILSFLFPNLSKKIYK